MLEDYFNKYDNAIKPQKYSLIQFRNENNLSQLTSFTNPNKNNSNTMNIINDNENNNNEYDNFDFKGLFNSENKKNLDSQHEISILQTQLLNLVISNQEKDKEILKLKYDNSKNVNYLLNLEKLLSKLETDPKGMKINSSLLNNNNENEEDNYKNYENKKIKIKSMSSEDLNKYIKELNKNLIINDVNSIQNEIVRLNEIKEKLIIFSKENDSNNENLLKNFNELFDSFVNFQKIINERNEENSLKDDSDYYESKKFYLEKIKKLYENIMYLISNSIEQKQNEFYLFLKRKNDEEDIMLNEIEKIYKINENKKILLEKKENYINKLKSEMNYLNQQNNLTFDKILNNYDKKAKNELNKNNNNDIQNTNDIKEKTNDIKRSVKNSIKKIKKTFDMSKSDNNDFINNIQNQIK